MTKGFNGNASIGYTTKYKANAGLSLNFRKNKINFSTNYGFRFNESNSNTQNNRENIGDSTSYFLYTHEDSKRHGFNNTLSGNLDYNINDKNTWSFNTLLGYNVNKVNEVNYFDFVSSEGLLYNTYNRYNDEKRSNFNVDAGTNYRRVFKSNANDLNIGVNYSYLNELRKPVYTQQAMSVYGGPLAIAPSLSHNTIQNINHIATLQIDYVHPFEKAKGKLETGAKVSYRNLIVGTVDAPPIRQLKLVVLG